MNKSYLIAGFILIGAVAWMGSGMMSNPDGVEAQKISAENTEEKALPTVQVKWLNAEKITNEIKLSGQTKASRTVELRAEVSGQVSKILIDKGATVKTGDVILRLEINDKYANVASAQQTVKRREIEYSVAKGLEKKGFNSKVKLASARADLETAKSVLKRAEIDLANTKIKAPFEGVLETRPVELGSYLKDDTLVGTLIDLDPVHIVAFISEQDIGDVAKGSKASAILPNGHEITGDISYVAKTAEDQTRTFRIEIDVPNPDLKIVEGLTAKINIPTSQKSAHKISSAILTLIDDGTVGLKAVDNENKVVFYPVDIISTEGNLTWVAGLPERAHVVVVGQDFVIEGQTVEISEQGEGS